MCGIAGYFNISSTGAHLEQQAVLDQMISLVKHRGPDGYGFFSDEQVGLAHARLSIIDLEGGWQPIHNEDKTLWVIFNGEIFNYIELRESLIERGHIFYTQSDTEVIVHLYEEKGEECLQELNGQFAIALYDVTRRSLFLARDRMGIRPLFYTFHQGRLYFASEVKSIFAADPSIPRKMDPRVMSEIFTCWMPCGVESIFQNIRQLAPGSWTRIDRNGNHTVRQYWDIPFESAGSDSSRKETYYIERLRELLVDAITLRLRADVPVGAYMSGGLDSSAITSLLHHYTDNPLKTFSVTFSDTVYDEKAEQKIMVDHLGTDHHEVLCRYQDIGNVFPDVIWHTEVPILRTAPAPLYLLSDLVRRNRFKVVLTGEGADEILGGYDIFKEAKIRHFISRSPASRLRPLLLKRLYPYLALSPIKSAEYARNFFDTSADPTDLFYGHRPRWKTTGRTSVFFSDALKELHSAGLDGKLNDIFGGRLKDLDYFSRAQYLESKLLLGNYLLSSQGDRMSMAHSVEGRYPFLDHRLVEFSCTIPPHLKMKALNEKNILKKTMRDFLPASICKRKKQPYMAPDILSFFGDKTPAYLDYYLSENMIREAGFFNPKAVSQLIAKCRKKRARQGFSENMAFVGILSSQIVYDKFVKNFQVPKVKNLNKVKVMK